MGVGGFLGSQAERDHYKFMRRQIASRVQRSCTGELEREVCAVLGPVGVDERTCQAVTKCLGDVEYDPEVEASSSASDEEAQMLRWKNQVGLTAFFLKFGEGMGMWHSFFTMICSFSLSSRGSVEASGIPFGADNWPRVFGRRNYSPHSILLCSASACRAHILFYCHRHCSANIWSCKSSCHGCRAGRRRLYMGSSEHTISWWCSCSRSLCSCWMARSLIGTA